MHRVACKTGGLINAPGQRAKRDTQAQSATTRAKRARASRPPFRPANPPVLQAHGQTNWTRDAGNAAEAHQKMYD